MRNLLVTLICLVTLGLSACSGGAGLSFGSGGDGLKTSPRAAAAAVIDHAIGPTKKLALVIPTGVVPDQALDTLRMLAPQIQAHAIAYLDATSACLVVDGELQQDPAYVGTAECSPSALKRTFGSFSDQLLKAALAVDVTSEAGQVLFAASILFDGVGLPLRKEGWGNYEPGPDIPLEDFRERWARLHANYELLIEALNS